MIDFNHQTSSQRKSSRVGNSLISTGLLALSLGLLGTACTASKTELAAVDVPADAQIAAVEEKQTTLTIEPSSAEQGAHGKEAQNLSEIDPADAYLASEYDGSEVDPADACIRNVCENPSPRLLSLDEINTVALELGSEDILIGEQSFALTLPVVGRADFIATESIDGRLSLRLRGAPNQYEDIYTAQQWKLWDLKAVAFEDIHQDGDGPDIIVIAEYVTGIGSEGALPFTAPIILFNRGDDTFQNDAAVNNVLSEYNAQTVEDVIAVAKADGLVRGLQYYEGP